jgi:hypothetical protein
MALSAGRPSSKLPPRTLAALRDEDKVRLNADIPKALYRRVKQRALDDEMTITKLTLNALTQYLSKSTNE